MDNYVLTILMPCLNEEANIANCIQDALAYFDQNQIKGEVLIVDNGSTDKSVEIAKSHGARVVHESQRGYGKALQTGLEAAMGNVVIIGDCDGTYDFFDIDNIYFPLKENLADLVIGNRFAGLMEKEAMPWLHKIGVPFLSWCGRMKFNTSVNDFHCGIRGIRRDALLKCRFQTTGMEFATEMIAVASRSGLRIDQVTVPLKKSPYNRKVKLRTFRDGFRHLWYILKA